MMEKINLRGQTEKGSVRQDRSFRQTSHDQLCKLRHNLLHKIKHDHSDKVEQDHSDKMRHVLLDKTAK